MKIFKMTHIYQTLINNVSRLLKKETREVDPTIIGPTDWNVNLDYNVMRKIRIPDGLEAIDDENNDLMDMDDVGVQNFLDPFSYRNKF